MPRAAVSVSAITATSLICIPQLYRLLQFLSNFNSTRLTSAPFERCLFSLFCPLLTGSVLSSLCPTFRFGLGFFTSLCIRSYRWWLLWARRTISPFVSRLLSHSGLLSSLHLVWLAVAEAHPTSPTSYISAHSHRANLVSCGNIASCFMSMSSLPNSVVCSPGLVFLARGALHTCGFACSIVLSKLISPLSLSHLFPFQVSFVVCLYLVPLCLRVRLVLVFLVVGVWFASPRQLSKQISESTSPRVSWDSATSIY